MLSSPIYSKIGMHMRTGVAIAKHMLLICEGVMILFIGTI
jgi:hypothetical protein